MIPINYGKWYDKLKLGYHNLSYHFFAEIPSPTSRREAAVDLELLGRRIRCSGRYDDGWG